MTGQADRRARLPSLAAAVAAAFAAMTFFAAEAQPTRAETVPVPYGFILMCIDHPSECRGGGASVVHYSPALMAELNQVNRQVNATMIPDTSDVFDVWQVNATRGDCEEYMLAKRDALIREGFPSSALRIIYALRHGGGHAILGVSTDNGVLVLDNMTSAIRPIMETGYRIVSMSGPDPRRWIRVAGLP